MPEYSEKLIEEAITCFKEENGILLTREKAIEYLDGLAGLFLAFRKTKEVHLS